MLIHIELERGDNEYWTEFHDLPDEDYEWHMYSYLCPCQPEMDRIDLKTGDQIWLHHASYGWWN